MSQLYAVTGRRYTPDIGSAVKAQAANLPSMYRLRDERAAQDEALDLERRGLQQNISLANKQMKMQEDQNRKSNVLGMAGLGINYGLGQAKNNTILADTGANMSGDVSGVASQFGGKFHPSQEFAPSAAAPSAGTGFSNFLGNYGGAIGGGIAGAMMGGDTKEKVLYGLGGAAIGDLVSRGSLIKDVLGSAVDFGGSGITKLFGF